MCNSVLLVMFGLLDADPVDLPTGVPDRVDRLDYLQIAHHGDVVVASCQCRRSAPVALLRRDFDRRCSLASLYACSVCTTELKSAARASASDRLQFWLAQHRFVLNPQEHLHAAVLPQRLVDFSDNTLMRPRRFIFSKFYGADLTPDQKVLMKCGDGTCLNPHHMHIAGSPAKKVNDQLHQDILKWAKNKLTNKRIQELVQLRHGKSVSVRTISTLRNKPVEYASIAI